MSSQSRAAYWKRSRAGERDALRRNLHDGGFACAAERFAVARLGLIPEPVWEAPFDARGRAPGRGSHAACRYEIKSRGHDDRSAFHGIDTSRFDVLVVCLWEIVSRGTRSALMMECRLIPAGRLSGPGSQRLNNLLSTAPVVAKGIAPV